MPDLRTTALVAATSVLAFGTLYSVVFHTYLDTSDPLLAALPHPQHATSYFARKTNLLNTVFIKKAWGWTSAAALSLWATSPPATRTRGRVYRWATATAVWLLFTGWFFGPALGARLTALSGGRCFVYLPSGSALPVPATYCATRTVVSPATHPQLFVGPFIVPTDEWRTEPRLMRGHDVSGHVFLLTMSLLFLADQLRPSLALPERSVAHGYAMVATGLLMTIWLFASFTTGVYFHTPFEKFTGYLVGVAGFYVTQLPIFRDPTPVPPHQD